MINIVSSSRYRINRKKLKAKSEEFLMSAGIGDRTVNIVFVGRNKMREVANTYKNEDIALPVLSFPFKEVVVDNEALLGEIFICYPQAVLLAAERNRKVEETILSLIKHGVENLLK
ncbi:MAG: rRNA maturation RNase YbeY [Patescibacteria group bacterium]